ncbi:MAG: ZPR1 zinc finger domain-containing protein [Nanobdellota archaeon]
MKHIALFKQVCPICQEQLFETNLYEGDIPEFGNALFYIMRCSACGYKMTDIGSFEDKQPVRYTLAVDQNLDIRVLKGSMGKIKVPGVVESEGGIFSEGYMTNVEGIITRLRDILEFAKKQESSPIRRRLDNRIHHLNQVLKGKGTLDLVIEDYTGNSAIISKKAIKEAIT